ncbi:SDR family NAD(P)-dependent oxidoreductase [Stakelama sp. CBK3Z-3]|uniref:SDR family NAD(P)-dependent oxidoreductase n=1 Tax=Stakelama flava TaxID=2860338 RepID=A0ABS6XL26_9SPHN|nr:SDR family NAD(P)-dependent oxidoreductase [Stakelama flava]MBW4330091.1 SDR family NAD(P)-dependent oxidoreductase [Stakelama flava]
MDMTGNTILITGGTSGIGKALAAQLLALGNTVIITGRTQARLDAARADLPGVHCFVCDQSDPDAIARLHDDMVHSFPDLNMLINNAGIGLKRNLNDASVPIEDLEREIRTNLIGPIQLNHQFLPTLKRQKAAAIVNVTSGLAFVPLALKPLYSATKVAMHSYSMTLRAQLARSSVRVFELAPPATDTEFNKGQEDMNTANRMSPEKVAEAAIRGMEQDRDEILPGQARALRLMGRLRAKMVLAQAAAGKMGEAG